MKIFLAGSSGMVGKNILGHKDFSGYEFLCPDRKNLNLLDYESVRSYLKNTQPDLVIHSAGRVGGINFNMANPYLMLSDNLKISSNLISACREMNIKKFINIGSSCMYPVDSKNPMAEEALLSGKPEVTNEGFALAKLTALKLCQYTNQEEDFYYKTIIPCNLYGRYDHFDPINSHMIPSVIIKLDNAQNSNKHSIDIWGDGKARREYMYAGDFADFIFYAIKNFNNMPEIMNVGMGHDFSITDYYNKIKDCVGYQGSFKNDLSKPKGAFQKLISIEKLNQFGWRASTPLEEGLKKTYKYFKNDK